MGTGPMATTSLTSLVSRMSLSTSVTNP
jgi:hypothetical protein